MTVFQNTKALANVAIIAAHILYLTLLGIDIKREDNRRIPSTTFSQDWMTTKKKNQIFSQGGINEGFDAISFNKCE